jgi:hypothetical protein
VPQASPFSPNLAVNQDKVWFTLKESGKTQVVTAKLSFRTLAVLETGSITNHLTFVTNAAGRFAHVTVGGRNVLLAYRLNPGSSPKLGGSDLREGCSIAPVATMARRREPPKPRTRTRSSRAPAVRVQIPYWGTRSRSATSLRHSRAVSRAGPHWRATLPKKKTRSEDQIRISTIWGDGLQEAVSAPSPLGLLVHEARRRKLPNSAVWRALYRCHPGGRRAHRSRLDALINDVNRR